MIVEEQPNPDHPAWTQFGDVRHDESKRGDQVAGGWEKAFTLRKRLAHQPKFVLLEIAQPAMDQLGGPRGGMRREVVFLNHHYGKATSCGITRNADAVDAAADDEEVDRFHQAARRVSSVWRAITFS